MEFVSSRLCCANDVPCMVISSRERTPEYFNLCDTMRLFAGHGNFTVADDKTKVGGVLEKMVEAKAVSEFEKGNIGLFRAYLTLSGTFLMGLPKEMEMPEGLSETAAIKSLMKWRDDATEKKWIDVTGCSPLHIACGLGRTDAVREMLDDPEMSVHLNTKVKIIDKLDADAKQAKGMGAATIISTCQGLTPLAAAMLCGDAPMIKLLIDAGAKATPVEFGVAAMMGPVANMRAFLACAPSYDVNQKKSIDEMMGNSALHNVCMFGDASLQAEKIRLLLEHGAAPSLYTRNMLGFTPLSCLAANADSDPGCVAILVDAGADVSGRDKPGAAGKLFRGVLSTMAKTRKYANMSMMVDMMGYGRMPIHHAAHLGNIAMLRALHAAGAPVDAVDKKSKSAHALLTKALPDSHAPELLADVLQPLGKLKAVGTTVRAVKRLGLGLAEGNKYSAKVAPGHAEPEPESGGMRAPKPTRAVA